MQALQISPTLPLDDARAAPATPAPRDLIAGLEKGLAVICAFDQDHPRLSATEVAQRCAISRTAARRYLITLAHLGFVHTEAGGYVLGPKVLRLAQSYMDSGRLPRIVQPELHKLASTVKEASSAGVLDGDDVICIAALSTGQLVSSTLQPGTRVPAWCTSNGRVLLAALPEAQADAWLAQHDFAALTPHSITRTERLRAELSRVRSQGYAAVDQEFELGLRTLAVPVLSRKGTVLAALNLSVHAARMPLQRLVDEGLPALRLTQARLRQLL